MGSLTYPMLTASTELKKVWMKISDPLACRPAIPFHIRVDQFCAYQRISVGPCIGDGGSPLININTIVGIVSIFRPCATGFPDIYTNVYMHTQFIKQSAELEDL
ncbi:PREDICTED: chymotrypsin-2-like [Ceratosolen solmsi marchali]|uniref:Chymotrypsin-2-like n=1 Tax=Ceratosolen solmsi marchali TaxID=326594 RepID=A0AAJ6YKD6_9HYME|nr:PREDICTED: chymotrypsin-2-like [Ceratosolen solmsi marchali]